MEMSYHKPTCNVSVTPPSATGGTMTIKVSGKVFNSKFGSNTAAVNNTIKAWYRYKTNNGSYSDWTQITATFSGNTYSATATVSGLNYLNTYTVQAACADQICKGDTKIKSNEVKVKTTPVFDWGENDFAFNVPVSI